MSNGLGKVLFTEDEIAGRIGEVADEIDRDYIGKELIVVSILKGSIFFLTDLTRRLKTPLKIDFLAIGVPKGDTAQSRTVSFIKDLDIDIAGRHVLLVEDVVGTGLTLGYIRQHLERCRPASIRICTLLDNHSERLLNIPLAYRCFDMPDQFVVGYGLDHDENYRNLPYIAAYNRK
ncbi:hypoxanthine phosphoribosyltransferase [Youngiibacter fragilis]|uniref:Hypoxanthine phosphoribosyltransferase n=1 Tax=Youngiibacter fragilis 232.1 TaxID=994573 RepID=V7I8B1_9CLOT|nr:hypoxanthine phosphoribosyltransferase [Youngiibacter fragilis]ETA81494.1 hypoxanthine phosphoribosyltransferase [Youngiibacter fragilis 232.1]